MTADCDVIGTAPHETSEPWPFVWLHKGQPVTTGLEVCLYRAGTQPVESDWVPAVVLEDGGTYVPVSGRSAGLWLAKARHTSGAVDDLGAIRLT